MELPKKELFSFSKQLAIGKNGEDKFHTKYPKLKRLDGFKGEFILNGNPRDRKIELKTDSYCITEGPCNCGCRYTENCFIELAMEYNSGTVPSGIHQAVEHDCELFVYYFIHNNFDIWFRSTDLRDFAVEWEKTHNTLEIPNRDDQDHSRRYSAHGVLIPRLLLMQKVAIKYPGWKKDAG